MIRKALKPDAEALATLINSAYRGDSSRAGWTTEADMVSGDRINAEGVLSLMQEKDSFFLLYLDEQDELLGCVHLHQENPETLYFGMLAVEPKSQAKGVGRQLLQAIEAESIKLKCQQLRLTVIEIRDELIAYYERNGFRLTGAEYPFPYPANLKIPGLKLLEMIKPL